MPKRRKFQQVISKTTLTSTLSPYEPCSEDPALPLLSFEDCCHLVPEAEVIIRLDSAAISTAGAIAACGPLQVMALVIFKRKHDARRTLLARNIHIEVNNSRTPSDQVSRNAGARFIPAGLRGYNSSCGQESIRTNNGPLEKTREGETFSFLDTAVDSSQ